MGPEIVYVSHFFLKTLCINHRAVLSAINRKTPTGVFGKWDGRGKQPSANKTDDSKRDAVKEHIKSFPTVESLLPERYPAAVSGQ